MARNKNTPRPATELVALDPANTRALEAVQDATLHAQDADEVLAVGVGIGRLEALDFVLTVGTAAILSVYENIKKSKGWRFVRNPQSSDGRNFESLREFCEVKLGKSYTRLQELAANRNLIGQEAYEQAERLGLRQVDYNAIRALPAPEQELVRRAVEEAEKREDVLALMQELASRAARTEQALTTELSEARAEIEEAQADKQAKDKVIAKLKAQVNKDKLAPPTPDEAEAALVAAAHEAEALICALVEGDLRRAIEAVQEHDQTGGSNHGAVMSGFIARIEDATDMLREQFALPRIKVSADDAFEPLPDDFLARQGLVMPTPVNVPADAPEGN